ncbi:MAG: hypothetical protein MN733_40335 [Nitrososphaera sp.]|nr:hypothetical protein [Nitrososphaera sp.]
MGGFVLYEGRSYRELSSCHPKVTIIPQGSQGEDKSEAFLDEDAVLTFHPGLVQKFTGIVAVLDGLWKEAS